MRDFQTLAESIKQFIPKEFNRVHKQIDSVIESANYTPPECMGTRFAQLQEILQESVPVVDEEKLWVRSVWCLWSGLPFEEIK